MANCIEFPVNLSENLGFFATNVVLTPIFFGLGSVTNLLCIFVLNTASIRKTNPAFIYLSALAVVDFLALLCRIPKYIRDSQTLKPEQTYSEILTYFAGACYITRSILLHVSTWYIALASAVFVIRVRTDTSLKPGWTKISISRIIAFVLCIASTMLNLPRFFEYRVSHVHGHCFEGRTFWELHLTYLGESVVYRKLYQWIVITVAFITPLFTIFITNIVLLFRLGIKTFCTNNRCMVPAVNDENREFQLGKCIFTLSCITLITYLPYTVIHIFTVLYGSSMMSVKGFYEMTLVAEMLLLIRGVVPGVLYFLAYGDFHKSLCRIWCCCADEYYEPCACVYLACRQEEEHVDTGVLDQVRAKENSTLERNAKRYGNGFIGYKSKPNTSEFSRWL